MTTGYTPRPMRWLSLAFLLTGCVPGCGGDPAPERPSTPVRLAPGIGGAEPSPTADSESEPETTLPPPSSETLAEPPPVEPPP